jgi:hypothetical protein
MDSFYYLIKLLLPHGVIRRNIDEASRIWSGYTLDEQRKIYSRIRDKLRAGAFVSYYPDMAILENAPKEREQQQLSFSDYYRKYGTTEEVDGWRRVFLPQLEKTIYVK